MDQQEFNKDPDIDREPVSRDRPLTGCWKLLVDLGLSKPAEIRQQRHADAAAILYGDLLVAHRSNPRRWVSYSRRREFYARGRRYRPRAITLATVLRFVDTQLEWGNIEHKKSSPSQRGTQSRMRLAESTVIAFNQVGATLVYDPPELIILRDAEKELVDYCDDDRIRRIRRNVVAINEALAATRLEYQGRIIKPGDFLMSGEKKIVAHNSLYRVFNRSSFYLGGRFYGAWWQNIKSEERQSIVINGSRCGERDYRELHPRFLYARLGKVLSSDAYEVDGWQRSFGKLALNTLINAETELAALRSIARSIGGEGAFERARGLIDLLKTKHRHIADQFGSGAGLKLMMIDSGMAESVQLKLIARGIVSLPVHDSFLVEVQHSGHLTEVMDEVLDLTLRKISGIGKTATGYSKSVPQYGDTVSRAEGLPDPAVAPECANDNLPGPVEPKSIELDVSPGLGGPSSELGTEAA